MRVRAGQDSALHVPATQRKVARVVAKIGGVGMNGASRSSACHDDARLVRARQGFIRQGAFRRAKYRVGRNEATRRREAG